MAGNNKRNKLCACGSGLIYKKCCLKVRQAQSGLRPKNIGVEVQFSHPVAVTSVDITADGEVSFFSDGQILRPQNAWFVSAYEGYNKNRVEARLPISVANIKANELDALAPYNVLYAIDTNTRKLASDTISIACMCLVSVAESPDASTVTVSYGFVRAFEFWNATHPAEKEGWRVLIQGLLENPSFNPGMQFGIITDSDLGNHDNYNCRHMPVVGDFFLPENFHLVYARDKGKHLVNSVLSLCDQTARELFRVIESNSGLSDLREANNNRYSHFRFWEPTESRVKQVIYV